VVEPSFSGLLNANETAVFETPAALATSAIVALDTEAPRWVPGHSDFSPLNRFTKAV
jgi:hypothetical protein